MKTQKILILSGICLIIAATALLLFRQWDIYNSGQKTAYYVNTFYALTPEPQGAVPEERRNNTMPSLSIDGTDFIGILEMPRYGSSLPVCSDWGKVFKYPCCLSGSIYDGTIQIGATSQKGQYDFYRDISVGDSIFFTSAEGSRYSYSVTDIRYEKNADLDALRRKPSSLTLFIKNVTAFEYIIIFCETAG